MRAATASHAPISANHSPVSPAVIPEIEIVVDQNIMESSELSSDLNVVSERGNKILSNKDRPEPSNSCTRIPEEVAGDEGQDAKNELLTSDSLEDKQEQSQKSVDGKNAFRELDHIFDANSSNADIDISKSEEVGELKSETSDDRKDGGTEEIKPNASTGNVVSGEITSNADSVRSDVEDDGGNFTVMHKNNNKVSEGDEITVQDSGNLLISDINRNENVTIEGTFLNGIGVSDGAAAENIKEIGNSDKNVRVATLKSNEHLISTLEKDVTEKAEPSCPSSASLNHSSDEKFADRFIKQRATGSDVETIVDLGSIAGSLDGNWGSFSDATPTAHTTASNHLWELEGGEIPSMVQSTLTPAAAHRGDKGKGILVIETTPLNTLLGEAAATSRAGSPINHNQGSTSTFAAQNDVIPSTNDRLVGKSENVVYPEIETVQADTGNEWNSPARYPVDIKTEKRSPKARSYWMPFLCCSSVNAG